MPLRGVLNPPGWYAALDRDGGFLRLFMEEIIMGWLFTQDQTRKELIQRRTRSADSGGVIHQCLRHAAVGNVLWTVWEATGPGEQIRRYIGCDLLACERGYGWGYKDMCESMGPCYYSCPLAYLDMVPVANPDWREQVRAWHAARNRKVAVGDVLVFAGLSIPEARVIEKHGRRLIGEYAGSRYRLPPRILAKVVEQRRAEGAA
jgi:hypothetical protein